MLIVLSKKKEDVFHDGL